MNYPIPKPREKSRWLNLSQGSLPLALARYLPHKRLKVVLTQDAEQALRLQTAWRFFRPHDTAVFLPDWETLPYERFSPHQDLVSERLSALWQIKSGAADVLFVPVATAMQKLPPVPFLVGRTFWLKTGQTLDIGRLKTDLVDAGYNHVSHVVAAGEFAVRGGIVDLFPMGSEMPYRIDLFDDEIDSIKTFDTETQRTISPVSEIRLLPAHEFPTDSEAQKIFRSRFREEVDGNPNDAAVYKAVSNGHFGAGVEYYLPLFFENELETLFDYIGEDALFVSLGDVHAEANRFWSDVKSRYAMAQGDETYPPLPLQSLYLLPDQFAGCLKRYPQVWTQADAESGLPEVAVNRQSDEPLAALARFQAAFGGKILLCAESAGRRETMTGFLKQHGFDVKPVSGWAEFLSDQFAGCLKANSVALAVAPLSQGFVLGESSLHTEKQPALHACFPAGTLVHTDKGLIPIEQIQSGDRVLSRAEHGGENAPTEYRRITRAFCSGKRPLVRLSFRVDRQDGDSPAAVRHALMTANHPLWNVAKQCWQPAAEIEACTPLGGAGNGGLLRSVSVEHISTDVAAQAIDQHRLTVADTEINYYTAGHPDGRPVILLHGGGTDSALLSWCAVMQQWDGSGYRLIAPDLPGYGASGKPDVEYSADYYADFLQRFIAALGLECPVLCGFSMGGTVALQYALRHPESVDKLVLLAPWGISRHVPLHRLGAWYARSPLNRWSYGLFANRWLARQMMAATLIGDPRHITPEMVEEVRAVALEKDAGKAFQSFQISEIGSGKPIGRLLEELPKLPMPVLFVQGEDDPGVPLADAQAATKLIPNARLEVFARHKHWLQKESPTRFAALLRDFCGAEPTSDEQCAVPVYNLEVEEFHTYFVGEAGIWVHNCDTELSDGLSTQSSLHTERLPENAAPKFLLRRNSLCSFSGSPNAKSSLHLAVITESELYQYVARSRVHNRRKKHAAVSDGLLRDLAEINIGDPVVHEEHGIGRYMGLVTMDLGGETNEMMLLEYAGEAQLYVPVSQLHLISRYSGQAHENVALHKLGSGAWNKAKRKAAEKARDTAAELLNLYAQRAAQSGHKFEINELDYQAFADGFGYEETEDQAAAIAAVIKDLTQAKPMDRLVCGDVGFGKTEVALRAAFVAVMGGKQVAVLAPTTLLVEQHAQNFADRFADFPVKVASLSRFNNSKATKAALEGMADGTVDIVIGTHKLVQDDIKFKNLGLVIIDEEHRFGVRQKEQLKRLRANVDILTMTATPIPRTLSMALEGLRDFSLITTAPSRRLAVKTFVKPFSEGSVREAVLRELKRGGQVFFLHNEVDTIENMRERLETLLPEARIGVAHGQLRERELEQVMRDFLQQRFNVLLCSTIIETGIDIPNANTIIINRADKFGLAQLHQLRGRVGRSHHQAYAYLLTPEYITKDAEKRLDAIAAADELGAGFTLAMQDLEIRGAGEILGEGQSGEMIQVGFTLYTEMLKQAVRDLKKGRQPDLDAPLGITTEIKLHSPALLPESYCPDIHERLVLYKRLAVCETVQQINAIHEELVDRFGLPEQPVKTLIESHHLRLAAKELGIDAIDATSEAVTVTFGKNNNVDPTEIILLIQNDKKYRLAGADKLRFTAEMEYIEVRINTVKNVLKTLKERVMVK